MELFNNHKKLFWVTLSLFVFLTLFVALIPATKNQENISPLPGYEPLSESAFRGKKSFIANGCIACHTQQVRNVDMDKVWGDRPGIAADYAGIERTDFWRNTATLMGTERTGPDLTNVGRRQPNLVWNLLHLYQPRVVAPTSIMPAYPWLFVEKTKLDGNDVEINVPKEFRKGRTGKIVASQEALDLVAYLQSLKQVKLPSGQLAGDFLYKNKINPSKPQNNFSGVLPDLPNGKLLYNNNCASCHQVNGEGLKGAFPPLKGSSVVLGDNIELFVNIIMLGYDARPEYAVMNAVGINNNLNPEEVTALINHERTSWGNNAKKVSIEQVRKIMDFIKLTTEK